ASQSPADIRERTQILLRARSSCTDVQRRRRGLRRDATAHCVRRRRPGGGIAHPRREAKTIRPAWGHAQVFREDLGLGRAASGGGPKRGPPRLAQRLLLLQEMENDHGNQKTGKKTSHVKAAKLAQKRNRSLLQDIRTLEKRFEKEAHSRPPPELTNLQILYWALVEKQAPKWEQALLGRARRPAGARSWNQAGNDLQETPE
uniref:Chromosome 6 open reading frame, human C3orf14 n=1 Tax=Monodelphis domestica TaxID=13616 RepID=A0A5F8G4A0_MONDO